ncbi:UDP-N-acetylmuramoyl-L-alanyl-D-glutamate--2,6-diaminopimelate ligase [Tenuibacillus multivorans]|uniref:UDP-N-acetylmuramyl-tripeptide synthetase n=1 Tax=Tenuibacillus multivorans TaxID=237069 RepID=A0A1G9WBQ4_9BACI|nr:UDP-N-acetylmuramoyl-L-alanyl-D-glutamate--2,6-diaminopimelate ligase [Tenuibacillus multivorans]GEL76390.1 UDP-N-acetylmuramoyl-L-alanyl-D-glutamate--2,6-diaminopimelate ligase [Tenuibacillus multivorans]SDM81900.1 UDP-N-acetylmuramoyl-L-alanyl-D-glutamate--2,6-diaminopimelate ligase [Tenuibacillus multivorans]
MLLSEIMKGLQFNLKNGDLDKEIKSIAYDSREVTQNGVFVAIQGFTVDGHHFIDKAVELGASAVIVEKDVSIDDSVTVIQVNDSRNALAHISANYYNHPTEDMNLIGITGTNGKTSTTYFIKSIYDQAQKSIGLIGTIGTVMNGQIIQNKNTTPESLNLQQTFERMVKHDVQNCMMEVSSHALCLDRVAYSRFNTAVFTNLTPDHLELHNSMEDYFNAKAKLFEMAQDFNIVNADDTYGQKLIKRVENLNPTLITYGIDEKADVYATNIEYSSEGTEYTLHLPNGKIRIQVNVPGIINVYNSLAAAACAYVNDFSLTDIKRGIEALQNIKGRFEVIYKDRDNKVVVDFAHTEDALKKALTTLRNFTKGRIILVFGVYAPPGDVGREKRHAMGKVAAQYADYAVVTSDNPKDQDPNLILEEIVEAVEEENGTYKMVLDRKQAIEYALSISGKDDVVLLAGKGHETSQVIGDKEIPFNEKEIVKEILKEKGILI